MPSLKARQLSHTLCMTTLIVVIMMVVAIATQYQSSAIQPQVLLPSSRRTKSFYQHREQWKDRDEAKDRELPARKMFEDYGTWDPAPYFGGGGYPAPIPHGHRKVK
nr:Transmembrane protein [Ipomoea batatas]GMC54925.1 Transmembrane protein [Ipomoea batatas]GMD32745.1 Transmembrane protein [Ipomoea batatas]